MPNNRYPLLMKHPNAKVGKPQAERGVDNESGRGFVDYHSKPDMFPPVTVNNEAQEAEHRAKGYVGDSEPFPDAGDYQEYPMWMSHKDHEPVMVNDGEQEAEAEEKGYFRPGKPDAQAVEAAHASPYVPGAKVKEYPRMENGVLMQDPELDDDGPVEYPKALTPPDGNRENQVIVASRKDEEAQLAKWGIAAVVNKAEAPIKNRLLTLEEAVQPTLDKMKDADKDAEKKAARNKKMKTSWAKRKAKAAESANP